MFLNRRLRRSGQVKTARKGLYPMLEAFEKRELLTASPFIQGTAFVDPANSGILTPTDAPLANATISVYQGSTVSASNLVATATTGADGGYLITSLNAGKYAGTASIPLPTGTYTLTESAPGYTNTTAGAFSEIDPYTINPATATQPPSITVTVEPSTLTATVVNNIFPTADAYYTVQTSSGLYSSGAGTINPFLENTQAGSTPLSLSFATLCVDAAHSFSAAGETYATTTDPQSSLPNGGQIGYLFNQYINPSVTAASFPANVTALSPGPISLTDLQAGVQVATWDLLYNNGAATGVFNLVKASSPTTPAELSLIQSIATTLVQDSAGQSEKVAVLDVSTNGAPSDPNAPHSAANTQSVLAAESFNFGNAVAPGSISGTVYLDATGNGLTLANVPAANSGDTPEAGVTVNLYSGGNLIATTTTASNGTYSFTGLPLSGYTVTETVPSGQYQTGPNSLTYSDTLTTAAPNSPGNNFSNYAACNMKGLTILNYVVTTPAGVSTTVSDLRGNTAQGDTVTANFTIAAGTTVPVQLSLVAYEAPTPYYSPSNAYLQVITSVATGTYGPGTYSQTVTLPNSFYQVDFVCGAPLTQLELNGSPVDYNYEHRLDSADNGGTQAYALSSLSGTVYADNNINDTLDGGDAGIGGVTVYLATGGGSVITTTTTASNGTYSFTNLAPGTYIVAEVPPSGYTGETSNVGSIGGTGTFTVSNSIEATTSINLNSNTAATGYNFGQYTLASPTINTTQLPANATVGTSIADKATLGGGLSPTGTVTFSLYNNSSASGTPLFTDTETLSGGTATSKGYVATAAGTDYWVAAYNGDGKNKPVTAGTASEPVVITKYGSLINTTQLPATAALGSSIADEATVSGQNQCILADIGGVVSKGTLSYSNGNYTIGADGNDIWNNADGFTYDYQSLNGDGEVVVRVDGFSSSDSWAKAGLMIRQSLDPGSAQATIFASPGNGVDFQDRESAGSGSNWSGNVGYDPNSNVFLKLVRSGNAITGYESGDGASWTQVGTDTINMSQSVYVGLAVSSHQVGVTAKFDDFNVGSSIPTGTVTFNLYNNPNASGTPLFTDTETLVDGNAVSKGYTATAAGTDYWVATYNGDSYNAPVTGGSASEPVVITQPPGSISGTVYVDASGSGLTTANVPPANSGDTPEAGVTVKLAGPNGFTATTVTAANGTYSFNNLPLGTYTVSESAPSGQYQTGPNSVTYGDTLTVASPNSPGNNFANYMACSSTGLNNVKYYVNGVQVPTLSGHGAEGATVTVTFNVAAGSAPIMLSLATYEAAYPYFTIYNVSQQVLVGDQTGTFGPGDHSLTVTLPDSYYQVDFVCGAPIVHFGPGGSNVDYGEEGRFINGDIGGTHAYATSSLSGTVYNDVNGNDSFGPGDAGIGGVTVTLTGTTYVGANLVGTTLTPIAVSYTTTTASNGTYSFAGLAPGTYTVTEATPSGYVTETANVGSIGGTAAVGSISAVALNSNTAATGYNFGQLKPNSSISGTVYYDKNFDDSYNCSDVGIGGVTVYLETTGGSVLATTTTASNGTYSFTGLTPGTYQVAESKPDGYVLENGDVGSAGGKAGTGSVTSISLGSGVNATGYNLAQFKQASPCGYYCGGQGQWQIQSDCGWWSNKLGNWLSQNCSSLCGSGSGCDNLWGQNNWSVANYCISLQSQYGANSIQCQMLNAALDEYFGKC